MPIDAVAAEVRPDSGRGSGAGFQTERVGCLSKAERVISEPAVRAARIVRVSRRGSRTTGKP
jgi:hypothetical protein